MPSRRVVLALILSVSGCTASTSTTPAPSVVADGTVGVSPSEAGSPSPTPRLSPSPTAALAPPAWSELTVEGPAAREDHTWTLDAAGGTAYLFGGRDGATVFGDLWAFDLASDTWSEVAASAPAPAARFGHEAAWVEDVGLVIVFGQAGSTFFNDLWAFDPATGTWRQLPAGGAVPVARYGSCAAVGPDGRLWISHGFTSDGVRFADTLAYDFAAGTWTDETPAGDLPVVRCLHGCWWTEDGTLRLYGGQTTGVTALGDLWELTVAGTPAWARLAGELPAERNLSARARLDGATAVFGGQAIDGSFLDDLFVVADGAGPITPVTSAGPVPAARAGAELVRDAVAHRLLLFGGRDGAGARGDLWQLANPPGG
jgi:hypothetical protein